MNLKKLKNQKGLSLIEILLYLAILSIFIGVVAGFLYIVVTAREKSQTIAEVEQQGDLALLMIEKIINDSEGINNPTEGNSSSNLILATSEISTNPTVIQLASNKIIVQEGGSAPMDLTNEKIEVSDLQFENKSRGETFISLRVSFTVSYINNTGRNEYNYSKSFYTSINFKH